MNTDKYDFLTAEQRDLLDECIEEFQFTDGEYKAGAQSAAQMVERAVKYWYSNENDLNLREPQRGPSWSDDFFDHERWGKAEQLIEHAHRLKDLLILKLELVKYNV